MKIHFIQTGGTIDKDYPKTKKGWAFEISEPAVSRILEKLNPNFEFEIHEFLKKDSMEITDEDRQNLLEFCQKLDGKIIITHGTDTMIETGEFLSKIPDKAIVLTGAMRPERFANSDAPINLGMALGAINLIEKGVFLAMHGNIIPIEKAARNQSGKFIKNNF